MQLTWRSECQLSEKLLLQILCWRLSRSFLLRDIMLPEGASEHYQSIRLPALHTQCQKHSLAPLILHRSLGKVERIRISNATVNFGNNGDHAGRGISSVSAIEHVFNKLLVLVFTVTLFPSLCLP